jgi:nucleoid DNA-binding protein
MPVKYGLIPHKIGANDKEEYTCLITNSDVVTDEDILEDIISRGSTIKRSDAIAVIQGYHESVQRFTRQGKRINSRLFKSHFSISGKFKSSDEPIDASRHQLKLSLTPGPLLQEVLPSIEIVRVKIKTPKPTIKSITDLKTNTINAGFTPGQAISIKGFNLKINQQDPRQGVFFIDRDGNTTRAENIAKNKPSELIVFTPGELSGTYFIEVRAVLHRRKSLRTDRFIKGLKTL